MKGSIHTAEQTPLLPSWCGRYALRHEWCDWHQLQRQRQAPFEELGAQQRRDDAELRHRVQELSKKADDVRGPWAQFARFYDQVRVRARVS